MIECRPPEGGHVGWIPDRYGGATLKIEHQLIETNGVTLHVATAGPPDGKLVLLLHGFPEYWYGWRHQIPVLAAAGFRVVVPDQRGFNESERPEGVTQYATAELAADAAGLIRAFGRESAFVVGHDFGATVAWWLSLTEPSMVERLVILNVPHPRVFQKALRGSLRQMRKSWYILLFQIPRLPEALLSRNDMASLASSLRSSAKPTSFTDDDIERYIGVWRPAGALTAMLNWYRAALRHQPPAPKSWRIGMPALIIWGAEDIALDLSLAQQSLDMCDDGRLVVIDDATHWVQHDAIDRVNAELLSFLDGPSALDNSLVGGSISHEVSGVPVG